MHYTLLSWKMTKMVYVILIKASLSERAAAWEAYLNAGLCVNLEQLTYISVALLVNDVMYISILEATCPVKVLTHFRCNIKCLLSEVTAVNFTPAMCFSNSSKAASADP